MKIQKYTTSEEFFKYHNMKIGALIAGMFFFTIIGLLMTRTHFTIIPKISNFVDRFFFTISPALTLIAPIIGFFTLEQTSKKAIYQNTMLKKIKHYEDGLVFYYISFGVANSVNLLSFILTANKMYLGLYVMLMAVIPLLRPTPRSAAKLMRLPKEWEQLLLDRKTDLRLF